MSKKFILVIATLVLLLTACTSGNNKKQDNEKSQNYSTLSKSTVVKLDDSSFEFLNYYKIKSEGDSAKDAVTLYQKVSDTAIDSTKFGFDIGFNNSKSEIAKRDSYLVLTLNYNPDKKIKSQRDSLIPKMDISAVDDKGDKVVLVHNSMDDKYVNVENPIGILVFKIFGDTKTVDFMFDGNGYKLELE